MPADRTTRNGPGAARWIRPGRPAGSMPKLKICNLEVIAP
jgi:hypothetical protein